MIQGISGGLSITGTGTLKWILHDDDGQEVSLFVRDALYVPAVPMCLLCPQQVVQQTKKFNDGFFAAGPCGTFTFDGFVRTISYSSKNGLPIFYTAGSSSSSVSSASLATCDNDNVDSLLATTAFTSIVGQGTEANLRRSQLRLMRKHKFLCHLNMHAVQKLARDGKFGPSWKDIGGCEQPCCFACMQEKLHCCPVSKVGTPLTTSYLKPGKCVFADQIESNAPGKIATFKGTPRKDTYHVATLYVDTASKFCNLIFNYLTALLESHDSMNDLGDSTPNESRHFAFAASNEDTLHYGTMKQGNDRLLFDKDMGRGIADLKSTKSIAVIHRDTLLANVKPVPSGIDIIRNPDGFMELTQPGLIRKIIQACGLDAESKRHDTPALTTILRKDEHGARREHTWKYRTLIVMLTYVSVSSQQVAQGDIKIQWIATNHQLADIFTKPLAGVLFHRLRFDLLSW